ncbi:hypothetical protein BANRA_05307 [Klebsiella pneumoniae]|nr:hypothetical protein BANRA_05307 [Klebsiella pneumoniae]
MAKSLITAVLSVLRWAHWLVKCAVVYPLAMMMLLVVLVFRTGPYTFGQTLVKTVESVQQEGYVIQDCTGPKELNSDAVNAPLAFTGRLHHRHYRCSRVCSLYRPELYA